MKDAQTPSNTSASQTTTIPENCDLVSMQDKIGWGSGVCVDQLGNAGVNMLGAQAMPQIYLMNPSAVGAVLFAVRLYDAIIDPLMGVISDRHKGKWGRRKPFILFGSTLSAVLFSLFWIPSPEWPESLKFWYFASATILFYTAYTIFTVPWRAMGFELTTDYGERTRIYIVMTVIIRIFYLGLPWIMPIAFYGWFGSPAESMRVISIAVAVFMISVGALPVFMCKKPPPPVTEKARQISVLKAFISFARESTFWKLKGMAVAMIIVNNLVNIYEPFIINFYVAEGDKAEGSTYFAIGNNIGAFVSIAAVIAIGKYFSGIDKGRIMLFSISVAILGYLCRWFLWNPDFPQICVLIWVFSSLADSGFWLAYSAMGPDYTEYDEYKNGVRREGVFSAVHGWIAKATIAAVSGISGFALVATEFAVEKGNEQDPNVFLYMRLFCIVLPLLLLCLALWLLFSYPITKDSMAKIRAELDRRSLAESA